MDETNQIDQWMDHVVHESPSGRFTSNLMAKCPNRDVEALTFGAQRARDFARDAYDSYKKSFASDRDFARTQLVQNEYWTSVERFLIGLGGHEPVDPNESSESELPSEPAKRRWFRR